MHSLHMDECIDEVISLYSDMVYRLSYAHTGTREDADDIFQEVFIRLIKYNKTFESEEHRKAWLIRVTINCCNSLWKSTWRKRVTCYEDMSEETAFSMNIPEETELFHALKQLPTKYRVVIHLFYYEEMSIKGIAQLLKQNEATIRSKLFRARQKIKKILEEK